MVVAVFAAASQVWPAPWIFIKAALFAHMHRTNLIVCSAGLLLWSLCFPWRMGEQWIAPSSLDSFFRWAKSSLAMFLIGWAGVHFLPLHGLTVPVGKLAVAIIALEGLRSAILWISQFSFAARTPKLAVILGSGRRASKAWKEIRVNHGSSVKVLGFADDREPSQMAPDIAHRMLCDLDELRNVLIVNSVDRIYIAMPVKSCYDKIQAAIDIAGTLGVEVMYMDDVHGMTDRRIVPSGKMFKSLTPSRVHGSALQIYKGLFDFLGAALGLLIFLPFGIILATGIKLSSPGPVFLAEERYGLNGRRFRMLRFRTLAWPLQAMQQREARMAGDRTASSSRARSWLIEDPRRTQLGRLLCATSIDEVAQLWNVLMGDMSLVGPRPLSINDALHLSDAQVARLLKVKPGITGLWQVSGRSSLSSEQSVAIDSRYINQWSLRLDFQILMRTLPAVAKRDGAA
jgi:lipopolysaccharide/colanic/teichoic acid biosynthesis glycosyltransferase